MSLFFIESGGCPPTTTLSLVAGGNRAFVHHHVGSANEARQRLLREVEDLRDTSELSTIWRADNKVPALQKFIEVVRNQFTGIARH